MDSIIKNIKQKPYFKTDLGVLYCADCLDVMKEMPDKCIDLVLTDPPYGIGITGKVRGDKPFGSKKCRIGGGKVCQTTKYLAFDDTKPMSLEQQKVSIRVSKNQIFFGGNYFVLPPSQGWFVWHKDNTGNFADCELAWTSFSISIKYFKWRWNGMLQENMKNKEKRHHPTQKPIPVILKCLNLYSKKEDLILDPFLGSGTTAVACEKLGRRWIGIEILEHYAEVAAKRIDTEARQGKLF